MIINQLLYAAGLLFLSATEEQMMLLHKHSITHAAYVLVLYSAAFIMFLCKLTRPKTKKQPLSTSATANS